ncbi:MAG: DUF1648 domain-containing protein [Candidatus Paceibacterota bacterium]
MKIKSISIVSFLLIIASFVLAFCFYPLMPDQVVSHWGITGEPDGYMSKGFGLFFMPILMIIITILLLVLPKIDPLKENVKSFYQYFEGFILIFNLFFFYIYSLTIFFNLGYKFNMLSFLMPALAFLFYYMGIMIEKAKRNYFIGIRTPWTLADDTVWEKTHKMGGILFKLGALPFLLSIFFPVQGFILFFVYIIGISLWLVVYSCLEFQKEKKKK